MVAVSMWPAAMFVNIIGQHNTTQRASKDSDERLRLVAYRQMVAVNMWPTTNQVSSCNAQLLPNFSTRPMTWSDAPTLFITVLHN